MHNPNQFINFWSKTEYLHQLDQFDLTLGPVYYSKWTVNCKKERAGFFFQAIALLFGAAKSCRFALLNDLRSLFPNWNIERFIIESKQVFAADFYIDIAIFDPYTY
jgi:hypothetical protein